MIVDPVHKRPSRKTQRRAGPVMVRKATPEELEAMRPYDEPLKLITTCSTQRRIQKKAAMDRSSYKAGSVMA